MAALRAALLAPLLALCRAGPGPAASARVEVAVSGPGDAAGVGDGTAAGPGGSYTLRGALLGAAGGGSGPGRGAPREEEIGGRLVLVGDAEPELGAADSWIGVVPVGEEPADSPRSAKEESFTAAVVSKMKRALVLGASALLILALNQNAIRELDVSQLLAKPVIVIQSSDNVTRLLGALLRGLRATAKITYQAVLLENLLDLKQHIRRRLLALKTRRYNPGRALRSRACEIDSCAVCLDQFSKSQWLRVLPCSHEFHRDCVDPWLLLQQTCPLCKHNILGNCCGES
ncbi:RING finger protein 215 isoform X2 [Gallus gallus]|uniref:RING finger protein 215 isoform X2 n=1 Tax=Gallus gallus TaxID=9031 RepID=UPI001AE61037|nr:RING finger protein 215 isoform X2 [Gallus gallus]XP_040541073.1 RING finger protein 215 isoform X2 [Gallus gallus]